jgi:hypothetical protein
VHLRRRSVAPQLWHLTSIESLNFPTVRRMQDPHQLSLGNSDHCFSAGSIIWRGLREECLEDPKNWQPWSDKCCSRAILACRNFTRASDTIGSSRVSSLGDVPVSRRNSCKVFEKAGWPQCTRPPVKLLFTHGRTQPSVPHHVKGRSVRLEFQSDRLRYQVLFPKASILI